MNHFVACASVLDRHAILISGDGSMIYAGPLAGITEVVFNQAVTSLVNPDTLSWIKHRADEAVASNRIKFDGYP